MVKKTFCVIFILAATSIAPGQESEAEKALFEGRAMLQAGLNEWNAEKMIAARALFERLSADKTLAAMAHYEVGHAGYRLSIFYRQDDVKKSISYLDDGVKHLEKATELDNKFADAFALLSSCYGQKIGHDMSLAMTLGPMSYQKMGQAMRLEPENPRVLLLDGMSKYYTPEQFGGSKEAGLKLFEQAVESFSNFKRASKFHPDWGEDEAHAWIGLSYLEKGENTTAKQHLERALKINPENNWVKTQLLPRLN